MGRGAWWALVHGFAKSWTWLSRQPIFSRFKSQEFLTTVCSAIQLCLNPMDYSLPGSSVYEIYFFHNKNIATYSFFLSKSSLSFEALKTK